MKIYFDLCAIQRPLDTSNQVRIVLESEAVLGLIAYCDMVVRQKFFLQKRYFMKANKAVYLFAKSIRSQCWQKPVKLKKRARDFLEYGIQPLDAIHLALAETGKADYFWYLR